MYCICTVVYLLCFILVFWTEDFHIYVVKIMTGAYYLYHIFVNIVCMPYWLLVFYECEQFELFYVLIRFSFLSIFAVWLVIQGGVIMLSLSDITLWASLMHWAYCLRLLFGSLVTHWLQFLESFKPLIFSEPPFPTNSKKPANRQEKNK